MRKLNDKDLESKYQEARTDLVRLEAHAARGSLRKESGSLKNARRNVARLLTVINERRAKTK
jgi:ribosomal protein L29